MGGGGGSSGSIDYPGYLKDNHKLFIEAVNETWKEIQFSAPTYARIDPARFFLGPTTSQEESYPEDGFKAYETLSAFNALDLDARFKSLMDPNSPIGYGVDTKRVQELREEADLVWAQIMGDDAKASRDAIVSAHADRMLDNIESLIIPKVELGMRQANMGLSSGFAIAKAIVYDGYNKDIGEFAAKLELDAQERKWGLYEKFLILESQFLSVALTNIGIAMQRLQLYVTHKQTFMSSSISLAEALYQHTQKYSLILTDDEIRRTTWKLEMSTYLAKAIASIAGASTIKEGGNINSAASAISGAATGAVAGAQIAKSMDMSGGWGAAIGAVVGGVAGYLSAQ